MCSEPTIPNGSIFVIFPNSTNGTYSTGTFVVFQCDEGFQYYRDQVYHQCHEDGTWYGNYVCAGNNNHRLEIQHFTQERNV